MARTLIVTSNAGETVLHVGEDGEISDVEFERLCAANDDWKVAESKPAKRTAKSEA